MMCFRIDDIVGINTLFLGIVYIHVGIPFIESFEITSVFFQDLKFLYKLPLLYREIGYIEVRNSELIILINKIHFSTFQSTIYQTSKFI